VRVLLLNWLDRENPRAGGAETHLHETFGRLAARGWEITLVCSGWPGAAPLVDLDGIEVRRVGGRHTYPFLVARHVKRILSDRAFDVVVEDLNKAPVFSPSWAPAPVVLLVHHLFGRTAFQEAPLPLALATWALERPIPRHYRGIPVIAVSDSTRDDLARRGLDPGLIEVVPNGIALDEFEPARDDGRFDEPTVLYLGRLKRYKRVDLVIRAVARLKGEGIPVRLLVAGKGDHRSALGAEARRVGLGPDDIRFLGFVSETEKRELLARAWVHCLTSPKEGWGISNLEAAASGTPTVASDSPGLRDSVVDGETGFLVPHGRVEELSRRIALLLRDGELRERLGRGGRRFAERFSWARTSERVGEVIARAAPRTGAPGHP
jgi:glycosyltransferase involved in cell wall biosynthesis